MDARIVGARKPDGIVERTRQRLGDRSGLLGIGERLADGLEEADLRGLKFLGRLDHTRLGAVEALFGLLAVCVGERAAVDALANVGENGLMYRQVLLRFPNDRRLKHVFEIVLDDRESDELGALQHTEGRAVDA
jgi:hypothetical protein